MTAAIILAAGASNRMGKPKISVLFRPGISFLEQCVSQFLLFGCREVVVVINSEGLQWIEEYKPVIKKKALLVLNPHPERGRHYSLRLGLEKSGMRHELFIHNVDNPFVSQEVLRVIHETSLIHPGFDYISPRHEGQGGHPIMVSENLARLILHDSSNRSLNQILHDYQREDAVINDPNILLNINSMKEYQEAGLPLDEKT